MGTRQAGAVAGVVILMLAGSAVPVAAAAVDTEPPRLVSMSLSEDRIIIGGLSVEQLTVSVRMTDNVGVAEYYDIGQGHVPYVRFNHRGHTLVNLRLTAGTPQDGVWTGIAAVTSNWSGIAKPDGLYATDSAVNVLSVDPATVIDVPSVHVTSWNHPELKLTISPAVITPPNGYTVTVQGYDRTTGRPWANLPVFADRAVRLDANGRYRYTVPGGEIQVDATAVEVVGERIAGQPQTLISAAYAWPRYRYVVSAAPAATSVPAGTDVAVNGHLYPARAGKEVRLQRLSGTEWRTVNTGVTRSSSRFTITATPPRGTWSYRVYAPGDDHVGNTSAAFALTGR